MTTSLRLIFVRCLTALLMLGGLTTGLAAQETQRVAAVVNDDVVSMHDLEMRLRLVIMSSNLPDTVETRKRIAGQVLRKLIDERLQIQEADRLKIAIGPGEIAASIYTIERQNNMPKGGFEPFLKGKNIDPETMRQQVRAELAWVRVLRHEAAQDVRVGEEEIDARLAALKANLGKPEYLAADIFLPVDNPRAEGEVKTLADRLLEQMREGAPFSALARQFSATGSSAGGDLGWVSEGMYDEELMAVLAKMEPGRVSPPIRTVDGYHLLLLRDKRLSGQNANPEDVLDVGAISLSALPSATTAEREELISRFKEAVSGLNGCDAFPKALRAFPSSDWMRPGKLKTSEFPAEVLTQVVNLQPGQMSQQPLTTGSLNRFYVLCSRDKASGGLPSRDDVRQKLEDERMDIVARRMLRDLRRSAFVEIRA
jgi:peptidyl-prolyl cis-trans isomerase SurA